MRLKLAIAIATLAGCTGAAATEPYHVIAGSVPLDKGPDGNSVILDAPEGLIVIDTGRHPQHSRAIVDHARQRGRPVAAVINTHWHMDHTTGNADVRAAFPRAEVYQSEAVDGALATFLADSRLRAEQRLAEGDVGRDRRAEVERFLDRMRNPGSIRPTRPVTVSGRMEIAGRPLDVHLARFAATEADVWVYDPESRTAIVGDLVVDIVPFMDTACADGWSKALEEIAEVPFETLVPGHGPAMSKARFLEWKGAFDRFVSCGRSDAEVAVCADGWSRDAASFIPETHRAYAKEAAAYYINARFRSDPDVRDLYCKPLLPRS